MSDINFNPEETVIVLKFPISRNAGGVTSLIHEIKLQRFKYKHIKLLPAGILAFQPDDTVDETLQTSKKKPSKKKKIEIGIAEAGQLGPLVAALSGLTEDEAGELDFIDLIAVMEKLGDILGK